MTSDFDFRAAPGFPGLAWGAVIRRGGAGCVVYHGDRVERLTQGFIEGAWNGPFEDFPPDSATLVCGSGGARQDAGYVFWSGTDNIYPLYSVRQRDTLFVSNSAILCMVLAGEEPDPAYPFYYHDFLRAVRLGFNSRGRLRTASGNCLSLHFGHQLRVGTGLAISYTRFPVDEAPTDYHGYYRLLADSVESVLENAASKQRRLPYTSVTACSSGYDTNAAAVLAAGAGCDSAVSFVTPTSSGGYRDSGAHIADRLGLRVTVKDKTAFGDIEDLSVFTVTPNSMSVPYALLEEQLRGRILVSGHGGDDVWVPDRVAVFINNERPWVRLHSGYGLAEYRLRVGLLVLAVPRIGSVHNAAIHRISFAEEMAPWHVAGDYDRPIPRRIIESAGIPRDAFGTEKFGGAHVHIDSPLVQSSSLGGAYRSFMGNRRRAVGRTRDRYWKYRYALRMELLRRAATQRRNFEPYTRMRRTFSFLSNRPPNLDWYYVFYFRYCFEALGQSYRIASDKASSADP